MFKELRESKNLTQEELLKLNSFVKQLKKKHNEKICHNGNRR